MDSRDTNIVSAFALMILLLAATAITLILKNGYEVPLPPNEDDIWEEATPDTVPSSLERDLLIEDAPTYRGNHHGGFRVKEPEFITLHNTANLNSWTDAYFHAIYMDTTSRKVSWHTTVDENGWVRHLDYDIIAWHAEQCNDSSIGVEVCQNANSSMAITLRNLNRYLDEVKRLYPGIKITTHRECTGKNCPSDPRIREFIEIKKREWNQ